MRVGLEAELRDIAEPLSRRLKDVDEWIALHQTQLDDLRTIRREIVGVLRPLVGEDAIPMEPGRKSKPGPKPKGERRQTSHTRQQQAEYDQRLETMLAYLRQTHDGQVFNATDLADEVGDRWGSRSTVAKMVADLARREQIVLDHIGGKRNMTKFYKLV